MLANTAWLHEVPHGSLVGAEISTIWSGNTGDWEVGYWASTACNSFSYGLYQFVCGFFINNINVVFFLCATFSWSILVACSFWTPSGSLILSRVFYARELRLSLGVDMWILLAKHDIFIYQGHVICKKSSKFIWTIMCSFYTFVYKLHKILEIVEKTKTDDRLLLVMTMKQNFPIYFAKIELFSNFETKSSLFTSIYILSTTSEILKGNFYVV